MLLPLTSLRTNNVLLTFSMLSNDALATTQRTCFALLDPFFLTSNYNVANFSFIDLSQHIRATGLSSVLANSYICIQGLPNCHNQSQMTEGEKRVQY